MYTQYEMTFIVFKEENAKLVKNALEQHGAKILFENLMGRRNFVFPIKKERGGFYVNLYFTIEPAKLASLDKILRTEREIARYLIIKNEENIDEIKAKIERMKQKKDSKKMPREMNKGEIKSVIKPIKQAVLADKKIETTSAPIQEEKDLEKTVKTIKKVTKAEKPVVKAKKEKKAEVKPEKSADDQERIKKLEEKLDELLKD